MPLSRQLASISLALCLGISASAAEPKALSLREALKLTADKVNVEDTSVRNARLELEMLQTLNKTRVELRPQLSALSFSNPLFLAASLGGSFSINRRTAPTPVAMELARYGVVEAELGQARRRIVAEIEVTHKFFALAAARSAAAQHCSAWSERSRDREGVHTSLSANRITRLDAIRFEQDAMALESECLEAKAQVMTAASGLMRLIGRDSSRVQIDLDTNDLTERVVDSELPASGELVNAIFGSREQLKSVSEHVAALGSPAARRRFRFESATAGYSYLKNAEGGLPNANKQYLLGGNVGHFDLNFTIPLRNIGDGNAAAIFLQARLDRVQSDFEDLRRLVRYEIEDNESRAKLAATRLELSQRKRQLAVELRTLTSQRVKAGLQQPADELWAVRDATRVEAETASLQSELRQSVVTVLMLCDPQHMAVSSLLAQSGTRKNGTREQLTEALPPTTEATSQSASDVAAVPASQAAMQPVALTSSARQDERK